MKGADLEESAFQIQGRHIMNKFFLSACCIATDIARCVMNFHRIRSCLNLRCIVRLDHLRSSSAGDKSMKTLREAAVRGYCSSPVRDRWAQSTRVGSRRRGR
ncbi:hypothetical protein T08_14682 [Trichinella sp. T8]|nr:hypothetical protein T08_14682 [Trichinella sp. T8]